MENSDTDLNTLGKRQSVFKCPGKGHDAKQASPGFSFGISAIGLVVTACPVPLDVPVLCLGMVFLAVFLTVSHGAWHLVGFSKYLWNHFVPILLFVVSNSKGKQ